jgi:hypothetical protein
MIAGEGLDKSGNIPVALHRKRGELQTGNPAFGAAVQCGNLVRRERQTHHLVEKFGRFGWQKAQVGDA